MGRVAANCKRNIYLEVYFYFWAFVCNWMMQWLSVQLIDLWFVKGNLRLRWRIFDRSASRPLPIGRSLTDSLRLPKNCQRCRHWQASSLLCSFRRPVLSFCPEIWSTSSKLRCQQLNTPQRHQPLKSRRMRGRSKRPTEEEALLMMLFIMLDFIQLT